jgi:hypothetical protein
VPGQQATFEFEIGAVERAAPETFSALVEGVTWLPTRGSTFRSARG